MEVKIKSCIEGARQARGLTVIIDVFRSSNTIISALGQGAGWVIPVGELQEAYRVKKEHSGYLLVGERKSMTPEGFDYGNSPSLIASLDLKDTNVIITTSAGTQGIVNATEADEILIGSFANAGALTDYIINKAPRHVTLVPMGFESAEKAEEDEQFAHYLKVQLDGGDPDLDSIKQKILHCSGADRLRMIGRDDDLHFALELNTYGLIPIYDKESRLIKAIYP
jgi:2-phosphosulfolactate phosphatase